MGFFWESRSTKEKKEEQMLSAILKQFESEIGQEQKKKENPTPSSFQAPTEGGKSEEIKRPASVEDFARFLSSKGLFDYREWEDFQTKKNG